ncbi:MAG: hypothetical protein Q9163_002416 [Psora crenata]
MIIPTSWAATQPSDEVDILILGAGWTSTFLLPLLESHHLTYAATTRSGHDNTIPFTFDPTSSSHAPYSRLPSARTILITFPLVGRGQSQTLTTLYAATHPDTATDTTMTVDGAGAGKEKGKEGVEGEASKTRSSNGRRWIQLGSTLIYKNQGWNDENSPYETEDARAVAEDELLRIGMDDHHKNTDHNNNDNTDNNNNRSSSRACVLCLAGLYGDKDRRPRDWLGRVARQKEQVKAKGAVHFVHGRDVARAVVLCCRGFEAVAGRRWVVTDLHVYDWWDLFVLLGPSEEDDGDDEAKKLQLQLPHRYPYKKWVLELMQEEGVRALPREKEGLGRLMDGRAFWRAVGGTPGVGRVS